jgi:hypothetical protein
VRAYVLRTVLGNLGVIVAGLRLTVFPYPMPSARDAPVGRRGGRPGSLNPGARCEPRSQTERGERRRKAPYRVCSKTNSAPKQARLAIQCSRDLVRIDHISHLARVLSQVGY